MTHNNHLQQAMLSVLIISLCLSGTGCGTTQVFTSVEAVLNGIAALQSALPTAGVPPTIAKQIGDYATAAAMGVGQCASLLAAGGDTATLVAACGKDLASAVQPALPPGTPQNVAGLVAAVYAEIQVVYAAIEAASPAPSTTTGTKKAALAKAGESPVHWQPGSEEARKLRGLAARASKLAKG